MKWIIRLTSILLAFGAFSQNDSLMVTFGPSNQDGCKGLNSATGKYEIRSQEVQNIQVLEKTFFFNPNLINAFNYPRSDVKLSPAEFDGLTLHSYIKGITDQEHYLYDEEILVPMTEEEALEYVKSEFGDTIRNYNLYQTFDYYGLIQNKTSEWATQNPRTVDSIEMLDIMGGRSEEHTSELQSPYVISYAVFCLTKQINTCSSLL